MKLIEREKRGLWVRTVLPVFKKKKKKRDLLWRLTENGEFERSRGLI